MKKNLFAAFAISTALLTACGGDVDIDPTSKPDRNDLTDVRKNYAQVFNGASDMKVCVIKGTQLRAGTVYNFSDGLLVIKGNVPEYAQINVSNGKLYIDGDVGKYARVSATVPVDRNASSQFTGFTYSQDNDPAIVIMRDVKAKARITTNHGFHIGRFFHNTVEIYIDHDIKGTHGSRQMPKLYIEPSLKLQPTPTPKP